MAFLLSAFWGYENFTFKVDTVEIQSSKIQNEVKIVHLSDLHGAKYGKDNSILVKSIEKQSPDFIVATGDMFSSTKKEEQMSTAVNLLSTLATKYPVYFVAGEHDRDDEYITQLKNAKVKVIENERIDIGNITLYGTNRVYFPEGYDVSEDFESLNKEKFNLLLAHVPQFEYYTNFGFDLVLSGDTHGGIADIPFVGIANYDGEWFPERNQSFDENDTPIKGLYKGNDISYTYVSGGLGNYPAPVRFMNRPEYGVITLKNKG
ncbi:MAG: metallophosphoesterase [Clostridia bacterium]|nr:metallophosphoesterase [Clostridia bacterium]